MVNKIITRKTYHFNNSEECDKHMKKSEEAGFKILSYGAEDDWYYTCEKEEKEESSIKYLSLANKKLKKLQKNVKNIRIERNFLKKKIDDIVCLLNEAVYKFDQYDCPSDTEWGRMDGKAELKKDIMKIINKKL